RAAFAFGHGVFTEAIGWKSSSALNSSGARGAVKRRYEPPFRRNGKRLLWIGLAVQRCDLPNGKGSTNPKQALRAVAFQASLERIFAISHSDRMRGSMRVHASASRF